MGDPRLVVPTAIAASALLLSACGSAGGATGSGPARGAHATTGGVHAAARTTKALQHVTIVGTDGLRFKPSVLHVQYHQSAGMTGTFVVS